MSIIESILASKASGFKDPIFILFASQLQSFSVYNDYFLIGSKRYLNPISVGSTNKYLFTLEDTTFFNQDTVYIISFKPRKNKNIDGLKGILYVNTYKWAVQNVIAEPAEDENGINMSIQQKYELIWL